MPKKERRNRNVLKHRKSKINSPKRTFSYIKDSIIISKYKYIKHPNLAFVISDKIFKKTHRHLVIEIEAYHSCPRGERC